MTHKVRLFPLLLFVLVPWMLHAQATVGLYATVGAERTEVVPVGWTTAGTIGLYYGLIQFGPVYLSVDGRGDFTSNMDSGLFGPRVSLAFPFFPVKPYAEVLVGASVYSTVNDGDKNKTDFDYRWVGGIDTAILPHVDWRMVDYSYSGGNITQNGEKQHPQTVSTGLVVRF